jgi:putative spermidine/putrescine transport system substrate-binding protein
MSSDRADEPSRQDVFATRISRRRLLQGGSAAVAGASLFGLAGCGSSSSTSAQTTAAAANASKPTQLVVRTWGPPWSTGLQQTVGREFEKETGIQIKYDLTDFGPIQTKIQQALAAGQRPPVDIVHTVGFFGERARVEGLTTPLNPAIVTNLADVLPIGHPPVGTDYVGLYSYTFPVTYNPKLVTPPKPMSWNDLFDPQYRHSFFAASTFEVLTFPIAKILGIDVTTGNMDPVWKRLTQLRPNLAGYGQDTDFVSAMTSRQAKWGAFIVGDALALRQSKVNVDWVVPTEGSTLDFDCMYVCRGIPSTVTYWAQKFIDSVLEPSNLTAFTAIEGVVPTNRLASPSPAMRGDPAFPFTLEEIHKYAIPLPIQAAARNETEWQAAYSAALQ